MRQKTIAVLALVGMWWWRRGGDASLEAGYPIQAAVIPSGFAALVGPRDVHDGVRVVTVDRNGEQRDQTALRIAGDVRIVGTGQGPAIGWREGKQIKLSLLDRDGRPVQASTWGKNATRLCEGVASNEYRFGVGWLESDDRVWFVHGPASTLVADAEPEALVAGEVDADLAPAWCGIASAERNVVLLWRESGRLVMNFCGTKACADRIAKTPIDRNDALLGFGCIHDSCLFATRDKRGAVNLTQVSSKGRSSTRALPHVAADSRVSIIGAGGRAYALAFKSTTGDGELQRFSTDGALIDIGSIERPDDAPVVTWAAEKLLAVYAQYQSDHTQIFDVAR